MVFHPHGDQVRLLDCVAGGGMLGLGVHVALGGRCRTVCYVERDAHAASVLVARMEDEALDPAPVWSDLGTFDGRPWRGAVDCICAGLPCQPYSAAGRRRGHADERAIWPEFIRIVGEIEPACVFLENVPPFLSKGFLRKPGERLLSMGYRIPPSVVVSARDVGASHIRKRAFVLAYRDDADGWRRVQAFARQARGRRGGHPGGGGGVADADDTGARSELKGRPGKCVDAAARPGEIMENPEGGGRAQCVVSAGRGTKGEGPSGAVRRGETVAVSGGARLARAEREREPSESIAEFHPALFAPGPESPAWAGILERRPDLEPALCGMADGLDSRVDRLRVIGNGVAPLAAAVGFGVLASGAGVVGAESERRGTVIE